MWVHTARNAPTHSSLTENHRGLTRPQISGNSPNSDDQNSQRHIPGSTNSTQVCEASGQKGSGDLLCAIGTRDCTRPGE